MGTRLLSRSCLGGATQSNTAKLRRIFVFWRSTTLATRTMTTKYKNMKERGQMVELIFLYSKAWVGVNDPLDFFSFVTVFCVPHPRILRPPHISTSTTTAEQRVQREMDAKHNKGKMVPSKTGDREVRPPILRECTDIWTEAPRGRMPLRTNRNRPQGTAVLRRAERYMSGWSSSHRHPVGREAHGYYGKAGQHGHQGVGRGAHIGSWTRPTKQQRPPGLAVVVPDPVRTGRTILICAVQFRMLFTLR